MKLDRRQFVKKVTMGVVSLSSLKIIKPSLISALALPDNIQKGSYNDTTGHLGKAHAPKLTIPMVAEDGRFVPIDFALDHPMEADHFIKSVDIIVFSDPIQSKGKFKFSAMNGHPNFKYPIRMAAGTTTVYAVINCSKHGRWVADAMIRIVDGGC